MWSYWRDKKGIIEAVVEQYPHILKTSPHLQMMLFQVETALTMIDSFMSKIDPDKETD